MTNHQVFIQKTLELAQNDLGLVVPNPLVGSVIVDQFENIIATGYHHKYDNIHAEIDATQIIKESLHEEIISFIAPKIIGNSTNVINNSDIFIIDNAIEFADIDYFRINYQYE